MFAFTQPVAGLAILGLMLSTIGIAERANAQSKIPESYYSASPETLINEMRQTPRPRNGMNMAQLIELDKLVGPRALACDSMFNDDPRMQERMRGWQRPQQVGLANECRRIIADYNSMQEQATRLKQAEQEQARRAQQEQNAIKAEQERKAAEARAAEQRAAFLARRPDFVLVINPSSKAFEVTKSLDGKTVINQRTRPVVVDFVRASTQSSNIIIDRYERLSPEVITEVKAGVVDLAKRNNLTLESRGLEAREARMQAGRKCVGQSSSQPNQRTNAAPAPATASPLDRVCPDLTAGLIDQAELARIKPLVDAGKIIVLGEIRNADIQARIDEKARKLAEAARAEDAVRQQTIVEMKSRPNDFLAIILPNNKKAASCSIKGRKLDGSTMSVGGYSSLTDFARATRLDPDWRLDHFVDDLEKLWTLMQQGGCSGIIVTGAEASSLLPALDREKLRYTLLPPREQSDLHDAYAKIRGFTSVAQLRFAIDVQASASEVKTLAEFKITDLAGHRTASERMHRSGYSKSTEIGDLIAFLGDEAEGQKSKRSAVQIRAARVAAEEARERERAEQIRREMPLYSVQLMCMEPMGHMAETLVGHLARSPAIFIQMISGSLSKFCQQLALPVSNPDVIAGARLIASDASGAQYFVAKAPDGRSMFGLIKRRGG